MSNFFMCRKEVILHSVDKIELPLTVLDNKPLEKQGYAVVLEDRCGDLHQVQEVQGGTVLCTDGYSEKL